MNNIRQRVILSVTIISVVICIIAFSFDLGVDTSAEQYVEYTSTNQKSNNNLNVETTAKPIATVSPLSSDETSERSGLVNVNGVWGYYLNNQLQTNFTGLQSNNNGTYVVEEGIVDLKLTGLKKIEDIWYYVENGKIIEDAYGLVKNKNGIWLVEKGMVNFQVTGLKRVKGEWYYFKKGKLQINYTGIQSNVNGTWLVEDGEIDFGYKGTYVASGTIANPKKGQKRYYVTKNKVDKKRSTIITQALAYLNTPYVYGGTNLKKGIDCSAFTRAIYNKAGISLERTARSQATKGKNVSLKKAKPGDLIFYSSSRYSAITHVAIYLGNNKIVHAGLSKKKVMVANVNIGMNIKCIKSYIN